MIQKNIQMEKWDGTMLEINTTVDKLWDKCGQLLGMYALMGCDIVSYPCGKGKKSTLKVLTNRNISGLQDTLGVSDVNHDQFKPHLTHSSLRFMDKRRPIPSMQQGPTCIWRERNHHLWRSCHQQIAAWGSMLWSHCPSADDVVENSKLEKSTRWYLLLWMGCWWSGASDHHYLWCL